MPHSNMRKVNLAYLLITLITLPALTIANNNQSILYWISSTNKTHNASCRYYQYGKGYLSETPSSIDCKICNGARVNRTQTQNKDSSTKTSYWISSTGKTHNPTCRYYNKGKGQFSKRSSQINCKICGGAK